MLAFVIGSCAVLVGLVGTVWTSRRTDRLREVDPEAAQRIDEARLFGGR